MLEEVDGKMQEEVLEKHEVENSNREAFRGR